MTKSLQIDGILMTVDIEKAFDSVNHVCLISVLEKFGFGKDFVNKARGSYISLPVYSGFRSSLCFN